MIINRLEEIRELDNTLIVVSGDHGIPGFPRAKCNVYDIGQEVAMAIRWPGKVSSGPVPEELLEEDRQWLATKDDPTLFASVTSNRAKRL